MDFRGSGGWFHGIDIASFTGSIPYRHGQSSISSLYSGRAPAYCVGSNCSNKVGIITNHFTAMGGNPNSLTSPCDRGNEGTITLQEAMKIRHEAFRLPVFAAWLLVCSGALFGVSQKATDRRVEIMTYSVSLPPNWYVDNPVFDERQDVFETTFQQTSRFDHRLESAA